MMFAISPTWMQIPCPRDCLTLEGCDLDAMPFLMLMGYLLGNLELPRRTATESRLERSVIVASLVSGPMLLGYWIAPTAVAMAAAGFGAVLGYNFPFWSPRIRVADARGSLVAGATALFVLMPRASAVGVLLFAVVYYFTRRIALAGITAILVVPVVAWFMLGSDLYLLFGGLNAMVVLYCHLDRVEMALRGVLDRRTTPLYFRKTARRGAIVGLVGLVLLGFFLSRYVYHGFGLHPEVFRRGSPELNHVAITFDDGPDPEYTPRILDILAEKGVKATFFVVGRHVDRYPEIVQRMVDEGHEVASHTYNHANLLRASEALAIREIDRTAEALERAIGKSPRLFRPPRGLYNETVLDVAHGRGYTIALWSLSSQDWLGTSPARIVRMLARDTSGGDVLLLHDSGDFFTAEGANRENTVAALGPLIDELSDRGIRFATVTELMVMTLLTEGEAP